MIDPDPEAPGLLLFEQPVVAGIGAAAVLAVGAIGAGAAIATGHMSRQRDVPQSAS